MSEGNQIELSRLNRLIGDLQWMIFSSGGYQAPDASVLVKALSEAKQRSVTVQLDEATEQKNKSENERQELALIIAKADRELALSRAERVEYASFLKCDYFTRSMFGRLEHFYSHTWDRLSEDGKVEMSQRVWEGVRRGEYQFGELPDAMKDREAQRMKIRLPGSKSTAEGCETTPESEKAAFLHAQEGFERKDSKSSQQAHEPVASHGMGSREILLHDIEGIDAIAANLSPPLSERADGTNAKTR